MGSRESGRPVPVPPGTPALLFPLTSHQDRSGKAALFPRKTVCIPPDGHPLSSARRACLTSFPHSQSSPAVPGTTRDPTGKIAEGRSGRWVIGQARAAWLAPYKKDPLALKAARGSRTIFGSGLLSHMTLCSIIGDGELNFRVRNGVGCTLSSMATKEICQNIETGMEGFSRNKTHGLLVLVSSTPHRASTSSLSTRSSTSALQDLRQGELILRQASRLDAFSGYPFHT